MKIILSVLFIIGFTESTVLADSQRCCTGSCWSTGCCPPDYGCYATETEVACDPQDMQCQYENSPACRTCRADHPASSCIVPCTGW